MKYLNIWNDIHPVTRWKGDEGLMDYLVEAGQSGPIGLMCAEEASIHSVTPFLTKERFEKFHKVYMVQGGYDISYYDAVMKDLPNLTYEIWPYYFLYESIYYNNSVKNKQKVDKLFLCMNYKPRIHRKKLLDELAKVNLLESNYFTWHQPKESYHYKPDLFDEDYYEWKYWQPKQTYLEGSTWDQYAPPAEMSKCVINVVTESFLHCPFTTEKTWNAIISKKPFIILGNLGIHRHLETLGFKLPTQISYSFDSVADKDLRIQMIVDELYRLSKIDLQELHESMQDVVEYNYQNALNIVKNENHTPYVKEHYNEVITRAKKKANEL
jgi:hypothetical protein